jgi:putative phosphoesterase
MRIGILSDSHGRVDRIESALGLLESRGADLFLHLGDIGDVDAIDVMAGRNVRMVFGNCDWDEAGLRRRAEERGLVVDHPIGRIDIDGRTLAYTHGHRNELMQAAMADRVTWLLHGHTHELRDECIDGTRLINPGALQRATRYTVALLDTDEDALDVLELPPAGE